MSEDASKGELVKAAEKTAPEELSEQNIKLKRELDEAKMYKTEFADVRNKLSKTFWTILGFNIVLVTLAVIAFGLAIYSALGGNVAVPAIFGALGTADVITVFKFSMDRVQRSLGDQVQLVHVNRGHQLQMESLRKLEVQNNGDQVDETAKVNAEIRRATRSSMQMIQDFTKIAEPLEQKPWLRTFPIRYGQLCRYDEPIKGEFSVNEDEEVKLSCRIHNSRSEKVTVTAVVIAVRPPGGSPDGGPFRFDFCVDATSRTLLPHQSYEVKNTKKILLNAKDPTHPEPLGDYRYGKDWYAFVTCQTEDGCWQDDHNKYWFELVKKPAQVTTQPTAALPPPAPPANEAPPNPPPAENTSSAPLPQTAKPQVAAEAQLQQQKPTTPKPAAHQRKKNNTPPPATPAP